MTTAGAAAAAVDDVLVALGTSPIGLTDEEAARRLATHGPNTLPSRHVTAVGVLVRQLANPLLGLLLVAAVISGVTGDPADAVIITVIVALSVGLGFVNEFRSERAVEALHAQIRHEAVVTRSGRPSSIDVKLLVPGDVVQLRAGDLVPADLRLVEAVNLECDEAVLTGESAAVVKTVDPVAAGSVAASPSSCALMGTIVHGGAGRGVVVATGSTTAFGRIALGLTERQTHTAFQAGLATFSSFLVKVAGGLTVSIFVINLVLHRPFLESLLFSLAIAIGITPQLLPAIVSVSLASGSRSLAKRHVLVKRLVTIEDLGNIEVLFTDKTGTLTEGHIGFAAAVDAAGNPSKDALVDGLRCSDVTITDGVPTDGNPLDLALWQSPEAGAIVTAGVSDGYGAPADASSRLAELPFDYERRLASILIAGTAGSPRLIVKGAPEDVLARCVGVPAPAAGTLDALFADGARVVAVAAREAPGATTLTPADEHDLRLVGFLSFVDPPRADAADALARLARLGVDVKIITGDNGQVATKLCADLGVTVVGVLTGADLDALDDDALAAALASTTIFARIAPEQKARIVGVGRRTGADVAFLGDGVNDAVALHHADVGISVEGATEVAKAAADIVLLERGLGVLADGVVEGRRIFGNTMKYVLMATSSNFGNMASAAVASLFLSFLPMLPSQILLNNLLYDVGQLVIPTDNVDSESVARPSQWDIRFVRRFMLFFGPISSLFDILTFVVMLKLLHAGHAEFRSGWFVESLATQTLVIYVIRTRRVPFFRSRPSTPMMVTPIACATVGAILPFSPLAHVLGFAALPLRFAVIVVAMIATYLALAELGKTVFYRSLPTLALPRQPVAAPITRHERSVRRRAARFRQHHRR